MRIRAIVLMTAAVLFCSLATIELTELLNLVDDTSNDFTLASSEEIGGAVIQNQGSIVAVHSIAPNRTKSPHTWSAARSAFHLPSFLTRDLLHSICIQRT